MPLQILVARVAQELQAVLVAQALHTLVEAAVLVLLLVVLAARGVAVRVLLTTITVVLVLPILAVAVAVLHATILLDNKLAAQAAQA
jgi:hypothetical protein